MKSLTRNFIRPTLLLAAMFSLASCGGGGGGGGSATPTATVTSISPVGMVQSATSKAISLTGTNFASGMTISVTDSNGGGYTSGAVTVLSPQVLTSSVTIPAAPASRYVTVALKSSTGTTLATTVLGVASATKSLATDIQPIFNASCTSCHNSSAAGGMDLSAGVASNSSTSMFNVSTTGGCSNRYRVNPGDPRRAGSVLIDKVSYGTIGGAACAGAAMPASGSYLTSQQLQDIIDWVAQGTPN